MPTVATFAGSGTVTGTIVDDSAAAIIAQNLILVQIRNIAANQANTLIDLKKEIKNLADACTTLKVSIGSMATMSASTNALLAMQAASTIQINNFQMLATKETLKATGQQETLDAVEAKQGDVLGQMRESVKQSAILMQVAQAEGAVTQQISVMTGAFTSYIGGFLPSFSDVGDYVKRSIKVALQPNPPSNPQDILTKTNNLAGTPDTGNTG